MTSKTEDTFFKIKSGIREGLKKGWSGLVWLLKILVPISFLTTVLVNYGLIYRLDFILTPLMNVLGLPASAAIVLVIGVFTGIYGTVAALSVMPFSMDHMILIAVFILISHNLFQEGMVQGRSGISTRFSCCFRLGTAFIVTFICAKIMGVSAQDATGPAAGALSAPPLPFVEMMKQWGWNTLKLFVKIFCIIVPLMMVIELAKNFNVIHWLTRMTSPVLAVMGLKRSTGMLWLTAAIFGLAFGSAVIVDETDNNEYDKDELTRLHLSIGINHAMIEDPILFLPLGLPAFWLWVPRLLAAIAAAWLHLGYTHARRIYAKRFGHKKLCNH
ncbi:MAG: nucleoside recognition domain-containing protein [Desulfobacterales bacterium]|nr:nucleoside recognition domain-containing protein [Desulfobacterales bacterium]